jgi:CheY-like chemotaxis protein
MKKDVSILLIENIEGNTLAALEKLEQPGEHNEIVVLNNMQTAIAYLNKEGNYSNVKTPALIFIDLKLLEMNAIELLSYIKTTKKIKAIPVIVFSSSWTKIQITDCYQNHANCIITKPVNFEKFLALMETIKDFWINIAELPKI